MTEHGSMQDAGRGRGRRGLGRGLNALLGSRPDAADSTTETRPLEAVEAASDEIDIELIERNPYQPRADFDAETMQELVASIRKHGVLLPLLVRPYESGYQLVAGERRLRAARKAGLKAVPCRVLSMDDRSVCEAAIEENLKRKDLHVLEKARAFQDYLERFDSTVEQLASQLSLNRSTVANFIRLLDLSEAAQDALRQDRITAGHARAMLSLEPAQQADLCRRIESESLSVRQTEQAVRQLQEGEPSVIPIRKPGADSDSGESLSEDSATTPSNHILSLQDQLRELLGARVQIRLKGKESGQIQIDFQSNADFARIIRHLRRAA